MRLWALAIGTAVCAGAALAYAAMPAAWMIGPLVVGIAYACAGANRRVPRIFFIASQATIGSVFAQAFSPSVAYSIFTNLPLMLSAIALTLVLSAAVGWGLTRVTSLAPLTATLGSTPGNAAAVTVMSAEFGADPRLVAFMQYIRVIFVVLTASLVARFVFHDHVAGNALLAQASAGGGIEALIRYAETAAIAFAGVTIARRVRSPSPFFIGPMFLGALFTGFGLVRVAVPLWLVDAAYVTIGLSIGLTFTVASLRYALRILPQLVLATVTLIVGCAFLSLGLARVAHLGAFTAYLAMSPGGLDSVAIIALSGGGADVPIVLAAQVVRLFMVALLGPQLSRLVARIAVSRVSVPEPAPVPAPEPYAAPAPQETPR